jgi:hypothetical protein
MDVQTNHNFYNEIMSLAALKSILGFEDKSVPSANDRLFKPDQNMTRGQAVKTLVLAFNIPLKVSDAASSVAHFSDVPQTSPYYPYIEAAYQAGLVSGYKDGTFKPEQAITRGDLVKMVARAAGWELARPAKPTFTDLSLDSPFYLYVETAAAQGILGDIAAAGGTFQAAREATRGETAAIIARAMPSPNATLPDSLDSILGKLLGPDKQTRK